MSQLAPTRNFCLIDPGKDELKSSYLWLPEGTVPEQPVEGTILDMGPETKFVNIGQRVIFQSHNAIKVRLGKRGDNTLLLLPESAIIATVILEPEEEAELNADQPKQFDSAEGITSRAWIPADLRGDNPSNPFGD